MIATAAITGLFIPTKLSSSRSYTLPVLTPFDVLSDTSTVAEKKLAISYIAKKYLIDERQLIKTIECESGFNNSRVGAAGELSWVQFMPGTWDAFKCEGEITNIKDSLTCMAISWQQKKQKHWSCWSKFFAS